MPVGTGAVQSTNLPSEPFVIDPGAFFAMTMKQETKIESKAMPPLGSSWQFQLPQTGIISRLAVTFQGTLTVAATHTATTSHRWPYGLLDQVRVSANGQSNLWNVRGEVLHARRAARYPAYVDDIDDYTGSTAGGDTIAAGTTDLYLTWEIDLAADDTTLVGALFAQSGATNLAVERVLASAADLFSAGSAYVTIDGTFSTEVTRFTVPRSAAQGAPLVIPDLSRLHQVTEVTSQFSSTGEVRVPLLRDAGQLHRLMVQYRSDTDTLLSARPGLDGLDAIRLEYGAGTRLYEYDPAGRLLARNNDYYGNILPYDYLCFDFVRENAPRDVILQQGVTELAVIGTVNSGVTVSAGSVEVIRETLLG